MTSVLLLFRDLWDQRPPRRTGWTRLAGAALAGLLLAACASTPSIPKVATGKGSRFHGETLRDERLVRELARVQATGSAADSAATERFVIELQRQLSTHEWKKPVRIEGREGTWEMQFEVKPISDQGRPEWTPSIFDRILPASGFDLKEFTHVAAGSGAGAPVVMAFEDVETLRKDRSFRPRNGTYAPGTVLLEFGKPAARSRVVPVRMRIYNTALVRRAGALPLAWNMTAAVEANLINTYIVKNGLRGLLRPDQRTHDVGLFGINAYDPRKIPVVFVHGLNSSPATWRNAVNEIFADPELDARYQPVLFIYPTGLSVPSAANQLRVSLNQYRDRWDPGHDDASFDHMVIIGHSMGGLLTRLQVIDSGEDLWRAFFLRPPEDIPFIPRSSRERLRASLEFKAEPFVGRVVFVAVPHRGSEMADISVVRLAVRLIKLPLTLSGLTATLLRGDQSVLNPALLRYNSLGLRSVDMLSPGHPYFDALAKRPIKVPFHSIIGDRGRNHGAKSSDGVVPYWSSHLDGAVSEKLVPYGHRCTMKPETVHEIARILKLHAEQLR